jgi:vitamin B12 transporter
MSSRSAARLSLADTRVSGRLLRLALGVSLLAPRAASAQAAHPAPLPPAIDEVRIDGDRGAVRRSGKDETPSSTVLGEEALRGAGASLTDALRPVAGVTSSSSGSANDLSTVSIRGATSAQLPVYLAGVRLNDDLTGTFDLSTVPTWMLGKAEVFRGNAPISADRLGIAGALFLEPLRLRRTLLRAEATVGSFGSREASALVGTGDGSSSMVVAVRRAQAANDFPYRQDRGTLSTPADDLEARRQNADSDATDAWALGRQAVGRWVGKTLVHVFRREQGAPGQLLVPALHARLLTARALGDVSLEGPCGPSCELEVGLATLRSSTDVSDPAREIGLATTHVHTVGFRLAPRARARVRWSENLATALGVDLAHESIQRTAGGLGAGLTGRTGDTSARRLVAHGSGQIVFDATSRLRLSAVGGVDGTDTAETNGPSTTRAPVSARVGARYGDARFAVLGNLGRAVRLPTLGELFGQSSLLGGNPDLLPERAVAADLGVRGRDQRGPALLEAQVFGFARSTDDLVVYQRDSFLIFRPRNVRKTRTLGGEGTLALTLFRRVRGEQSATFLDARDTSNAPNTFDGQLPFLPRLTSSSRLTLFAWVPEPNRELAFVATLIRTGARFGDRSGLVVIPAQTTLDLETRWRLPFGAQTGAVLRLRADNVTSARRVDVIGYPLPPRQFFLSLELRHEPGEAR